MPTRSGGGADAERIIRVVYEIDGVEDATANQGSFEDSLRRTGEAMGEQSGAADRAEGSTRSLAGAATEAGQQAILTQQRISALAAGLSGLGSAIGSESELGSTLGRMGQLAATGVSLGSMFGPQGAVAGGIIGATVPAIQSLTEALSPVAPAIADVTEHARQSGQAAIEMGDAFIGAGDRMREFVDGVSTSSRARGLQDLNAQITELADQIARVSASGTDLERLGLPGLRDRMSALSFEASDVGGGISSELREAGSGRRRGGGRGGRRRVDPLEELMQRAAGGSDAVGFAAGLEGADVSGAPSAFDVEAADLQRQGRNRRFGGSTQAEIQAIDRLKREQEDAHNKQMARIQEQVDAWTAAGEKIGSTVYSAFTTAVSGQENFDVAMVKGFKNLAVQFGGQMVNEGIAALLTAAGNTVANPLVASTKAAEGAGKLALGIGLGAAGAAIPVPSSGGGEQARPPRLGPTGSEGASGGSVVVNMNAPAVVAGTRAELGREIGTTLRDARNRFGRVSL